MYICIVGLNGSNLFKTSDIMLADNIFQDVINRNIYFMSGPIIDAIYLDANSYPFYYANIAAGTSLQKWQTFVSGK